MDRRIRVAAGTLLTAIGLTGSIAFGPWSAFAARSATPSPTPTASPPQAALHATMDRMMSAMVGPKALARMHDVPGAEALMDQCSAMMTSMGQMSGMMGSS